MIVYCIMRRLPTAAVVIAIVRLFLQNGIKKKSGQLMASKCRNDWPPDYGILSVHSTVWAPQTPIVIVFYLMVFWQLQLQVLAYLVCNSSWTCDGLVSENSSVHSPFTLPKKK